MNDSIVLVAGAVLALVSCLFGVVPTYRARRQVLVFIAKEVEVAERDLLEDIEEIGRDELEKTPSGRELLASLGQTIAFQAGSTPEMLMVSPVLIEQMVMQRLHMNVYEITKRMLDVVIAALALVLVSPVMALIALLIVLDSEGPVIFVQKRVGARRCSRDPAGDWEITYFDCYKFRTMSDRCDQSRHEAFIKALVTGKIGAEQEGSLPNKLNNDPRVTRVGRLLRKSSLDELPQLFNVLKGEMSLVGPRPLALYEVDEYEPWHRQRLKVKPGLTGLWQVTAASSSSFDEMTRLDIQYIEQRSLLLDIKILLRTIPAALSGKVRFELSS